MAAVKDCKVCGTSGLGWGCIVLSDTTGICKDCMNLIRSMDKNTGPAEGLQKKMDHWDKKGREIEIAQAINLAQNHVLQITDKKTAKEILEQIEILYPHYLKLLIEAKK